MSRTTRLMENLNKEHCAFPKAVQRAYFYILMKAAGRDWVRKRRSEDVNWMPRLKGSDDFVMLDSVGA